MKEQKQSKLNKKLSQKLISSEKSFELNNESSPSTGSKITNNLNDETFNLDEDENEKVYVNFICKDSSIKYESRVVLIACPALEKLVSNLTEDIIYNDSKSVKSYDLSEYIEIAFLFSRKSDKLHMKSYSISLENLLELSSYFNNQNLCEYLITTYALSSLSKENSLYYLDNSYSKINSDPQFRLSPNNCWIKLYNTAIEIVLKHFNFFLENLFNEIKLLEDEILEELLDRYDSSIKDRYIRKCNKELGNCFKDNFLSKIITLLLSMRKREDIYELLVYESNRLLREDLEFQPLKSEPFLVFTISNDMKNLYKEYSGIPLDKYEITFSSFYKTIEDCFYLTFKINFENTQNIPILSVFSEVELQEVYLKAQKNTFYINKNKYYSTVFQLQNFSSILKKMSENNKHSINFKIYLKVDYIQTVILNHLCCNFYRYHKLPSISLLPKKLLEIILKNKYLILESNDQVIIALMYWNEHNQAEDISTLLETIEWKHVSFEIILEFILKFSKNIEKFEYEPLLLKILESKLSESKQGIFNNIINMNSGGHEEADNSFALNGRNSPERIDVLKVLISSFINASKKINISTVFEQNAKLLKEMENNRFTNLSSTKAESLLIPNHSSLQYISKKSDDSPFIDNKSNKINKFQYNNFTEISKNEIYLNTETPQKIERFKSLGAFPFTKLKVNKVHVSDCTKMSAEKPKSIVINNEKRLDFFYNVDADRTSELRKYKNLGINLSNINSKPSRGGNSLNEKSLNKKSFEKKNMINISNNSNQQSKTKRITFIEYNKEQFKKK